MGKRTIRKKGLRYVSTETTRYGGTVYYFRKRGLARKVRLPGEPGTVDFVTAYQTCLSGVEIERSTAAELVRRSQAARGKTKASREDILLNLDDVLAASIPVKGVATIGIYFLIDDRSIVYVGQSEAEVSMRILQHLRDPEKTFDRVCILPCPARMLNTLEQLYIERFRPKYNVQFNPIQVRELKP